MRPTDQGGHLRQGGEEVYEGQRVVQVANGVQEAGVALLHQVVQLVHRPLVQLFPLGGKVKHGRREPGRESLDKTNRTSPTGFNL